MEMNLSAEMVFALYNAACRSEVDSCYYGKNPSKEQFDLMREFKEMVEDMSKNGIDRILTDRMNRLRKW